MKISDFSWNHQITEVAVQTDIWKSVETGESGATEKICLTESELASIINCKNIEMVILRNCWMLSVNENRVRN